MKKILFILFGITILLNCTQKKKDLENTDCSYLKQLNKYKDKVSLIVNGDDFGVTEIFTNSTIKAYLEGGISSTSIIATGHDVERAIILLKKHPNLPVGVHLTLNGDWKPLTPGKSLRNEKGLMWNTPEEVVKNVNPEEALIEWEAQIKKILDAGIDVTHLDSHMGCYFLSNDLFRSAFSLSKKYKIPLISPYYKQIPDQEKKLLLVDSYSGIYFIENIEEKEETLENRTKAYWKMLNNLKPGIHYVYTHQGVVSDKNQITGDLNIRINEYKFWTDKKIKKQLSNKGFLIIGSTLLKEEYKKILADK